MQLPLEIDFRNVDRSPALEARIREQAARLERFSRHIIRLRVAVDAPHNHHRQGNLFNASLRITVPGEEIVVSEAPPEDHAHEDAYVALRDAFNAARRRLQDYERRLQDRAREGAAAGA